MKVEVQKLPKSEVKLTIEVPEKNMEEFEKQAAKELQEKVKVPGFRPGHIPLEVLKKQVGDNSFMGVVMDLAINESYEKAIKQEKILPVAYPKISIVSDKPLKFDAIVPVVPEVSLKKNVDKIKVKAEKVEITKAELEDVLENLSKRSQTWKDVERKAKKGDRVEIDFDGFDSEGIALEGTASKNHPVVLGEGTLIPGFEEEIEGMEKDEAKEFDITFPKDYHSKKFQSKKVKFKIKLNRIEEAEKTKMDDEFAEKLTGGKHKTLDSLKEEITSELMHQKEHGEENRLETDFLEKLADHVEAELPEALIEREKKYLKEKLQGDLDKRNTTMEAYEDMLKEKKKDLDKELSEQAEKQLLIRLGLEKIYEQEKIEVTKADVEKEIGHMLSHYPEAYAHSIKENYKEGSEQYEHLQNMLRLKKLVKKHSD
ncbi:MAG: trigger factor [Patescibacteria group bacterium]